MITNIGQLKEMLKGIPDNTKIASLCKSTEYFPIKEVQLVKERGTGKSILMIIPTNVSLSDELLYEQCKELQTAY